MHATLLFAKIHSLLYGDWRCNRSRSNISAKICLPSKKMKQCCSITRKSIKSLMMSILYVCKITEEIPLHLNNDARLPFYRSKLVNYKGTVAQLWELVYFCVLTLPNTFIISYKQYDAWPDSLHRILISSQQSNSTFSLPASPKVLKDNRCLQNSAASWEDIYQD